jgi:hypothetical protein
VSLEERKPGIIDVASGVDILKLMLAQCLELFGWVYDDELPTDWIGHCLKEGLLRGQGRNPIKTERGVRQALRITGILFFDVSDGAGTSELGQTIAFLLSLRCRKSLETHLQLCKNVM